METSRPQVHPVNKGSSKVPSCGVLQRKCACGQHTGNGGECEACKKKRLQRKAAHQAEPSSVPPIVHEVLRSPGQPLDSATRAFMEPRFGADFSGVRVHTDAKAAESARAVNALAYTVGRNVVFGEGQYAPGTNEGKKLFAHELTHVQQQAANSFVEAEDSGSSSVIPNMPDTPVSLMRKANNGGAGSAALPQVVRESMEEMMGTSFDSVRVHADGERANHTALSGARAITRGDEISFAPGHFSPHSQEGRALIAHELTHVVQQRRGSLGSISNMAHLEQEAQAAERNILAAKSPAIPNGQARVGEQRADFGEMLELIQAAASGGLAGAADYIVKNLGKDNPLIQRIDRMQKMAQKRSSEIVFPASLVLRLQALYDQIRSLAPSWLPLPDIRFVTNSQPAAPLLVVAGVAITAEALLLLFLMLIVFVYLLQNLDPATRRRREKDVEHVLDEIEELLKPKPVPVPVPKVDPKPEPEPKPDPKPKNKPDGTTDIFPKLPCPFPTGLTPADPIHMNWYKPRVDDYYPARLSFSNGLVYGRDDPTNPRKLPKGEPLGVPNKYWPRIGKVMQLFPTPRGSAAADFRAVLSSYGFDWLGLEADHVQDVDWGGADDFTNLWPMSSDANKSAGPRQNQHQKVSYCENPDTSPHVDEPLSVFKTLPGRIGRFFAIKKVER
ncbi:MAG: hypothetical protein Fur0022_08870 [Anaerolineales bacterium]